MPYLTDTEDGVDHILIVSSDCDLREQIAAIFIRRGYRVDKCDDLEKAFNFPNNVFWDLVVINNPEERDSIIIAEDVRANFRLSKATILLLQPGESKAMKGRLNVSHIYEPQTLPLPLDPSQLLVRVSTLLRLRKLQRESIASESTVAMQNARLREYTARVQRELNQAQTILNSLLPKALPPCKQCLFAVHYIPLDVIGGDLFDIWSIDEDTYGVFVGDVSGHGLPAAFVAAMTKMALSYAPKLSPEDMLSHMTAGLTQYLPEGSFITACAAFLNVKTRRLTVARAGHPPGIIWHAKDNTTTSVTPRGFPLGISETARYELFDTELEVGDKFIIYTDGISETINFNGDFFGHQGVVDIFAEHAPCSGIASCIEAIKTAQTTFAEGRIIKDDCTILGLDLIARI